jgi:hypothetical protein
MDLINTEKKNEKQKIVSCKKLQQEKIMLISRN